MDNRLVLTVLFVMLSWISVGTYAQNSTAAGNNMTTAAPNNMTTAAPNNVTTAAPNNMTTVAPNNMTTAAPNNMTTAAPNNMTTAAPNNMTTAAPNNMTTAAPNNMTTAAPNNMTTVAPNNMTTTAPNNMTTVAPNNMTTTAPNNMTTTAPNMTTAAPNNMTTTAPNNMTTAAPNNMTTTAPNNMTTAAPNNMTTSAPNNMTTSAPNNMTTAAPNNMTTSAPNNMTTATTVPTTTPATTAATTTRTTKATTLAPPLVPNTTVEILVALITRTGCGTSKLCLDQPSLCTPGAGGCSFCSLSQTSGQNFAVELSGESDGYVAVSVSTDATQGGNDQTYICANANGVVRFFSALLNNGVLTVTELSVNSVRGRVVGGTIQCIFAVTLPDSTNRASALSVAVVNGTFNNSTNAFGTPVSQIQTGVIDLANPSSDTTNLLSHGITLQQSLTQALLIAVGVLSLTRL